MREKLERRLEELRQELQLGEARLRELDLQQMQLRETMLRIDGAVRLLTELLEHADSTAQAEGVPSDAANEQSTG